MTSAFTNGLAFSALSTSIVTISSTPCSWKECEAPEVLPRTLVETTIHELIRLLPVPLRRLDPYTSWSDHFGNCVNHIAHVPGIIERNPVFLWGKLPCRNSIFLLLKLDYPKSDYFRLTQHQTIYTFVHNCPPVSLQGILTDGVIRPSSWKHAREANYFPSLGFYCRCCYPGSQRVSAVSICEHLPTINTIHKKNRKNFERLEQTKKPKQKVQTYVSSPASPGSLSMGLNLFFWVWAVCPKVTKNKKTKSSDLCLLSSLS